MFSKLLTLALRTMSAVVYIAALALMFSIPVLFAVQAFKPPVFTLNKTEYRGVTENDTRFVSKRANKSNWRRVDFHMTAESGRFSPYFYNIDRFVLAGNNTPGRIRAYKLVLDAPLHFTNTKKDDFVLTLYVDTDAADSELKEILRSAKFKAAEYEKGFGSFSAVYAG